MRASIARVGRVDDHDASDLVAPRGETLNLIVVRLAVHSIPAPPGEDDWARLLEAAPTE